jgi:hypothetical protein
MASIASNSTKTISMKRPADDPLLAKDINILDRLVWVRSDDDWFPAIIYKSYSEVQQHLYKYLDTTTKCQFAMAIMLEMNSAHPTKVARLLGKPSVELVSVEEDEYHEFYWNLAKMIRRGSDLSRFGDDVLYLEFHQALDEVVEIFSIYSRKGEGFELIVPDSGYRSWYEAARARLDEVTEEEHESRDARYEYISGRNDSRDGSSKKGHTSCLKKNRKWTSSDEMRESAVNGRRSGRSPSNTDDEGSRSSYNRCQSHRSSKNRGTTSTVNWTKSSGSESKSRNLQFERAQGKDSAHDNMRSSKKPSKARIVWE